MWGGSPAGHYFALGTDEGEAKVKGDYVLVLNGDRESAFIEKFQKAETIFSYYRCQYSPPLKMLMYGAA